MNFRKLGKTGISVSEIGLGGEWLNDKSPDVVKKIFDSAICAGVNIVDVFMPQSETRKAVGKALAGRREKMTIQGHLCTVMENGQYERSRDLNKVKSSFQSLLKDLGTDYVEIGMIHYVDDFDDFDKVFGGEIYQYALQLQKEGKIHHIGLSSHNPLVSRRAVEQGLIDVLMFSINPAYDFEDGDADIFEMFDFKGLEKETLLTNKERQDLYLACEKHGVAITVMKALGAGLLLDAEKSPFGVALSVPQCCHYSLTRPAVCSVLVGCGSADEMQTALTYFTATEEEKNYSAVFSGKKKVHMTGRCMYCNHCLPCPQNIDIAKVTKFLHLASMQDNLPDSVKQHYFALANNASHCIECGNCQSNCPFAVDIIGNMKKAQKLFGDR